MGKYIVTTDRLFLNGSVSVGRGTFDSKDVPVDEEKIKETLELLEKYLQEDVGRLLFLRLLTAKAILTSALNREKSLGAHFIKEN